MDHHLTSSSPSLSELPDDELAHYGGELGLPVDLDTPRGELLRLIRERQELLLELDRDALLDIVVWARLPVRRSAGKEVLANRISQIVKIRFDGLSDRGARALARLRGIALTDDDPRETIEKRLRRSEGLWARVRRKRRSVVGSMVSQWFEKEDKSDAYCFLPETGGEASLKEDIEEAGVVGGIARKLRGVADQYVEQKLDDIEQRIDRKLDEIDHRLGEWRDREIANRLRIVKITLITAIIVAVVSLGYDYLASRGRPPQDPSGAGAAVERTDTP